jgi:hypothetical protein
MYGFYAGVRESRAAGALAKLSTLGHAPRAQRVQTGKSAQRGISHGVMSRRPGRQYACACAGALLCLALLAPTSKHTPQASTPQVAAH